MKCRLALNLITNAAYPLEKAAKAHERLAQGRVSGTERSSSSILVKANDEIERAIQKLLNYKS